MSDTTQIDKPKVTVRDRPIHLHPVEYSIVNWHVTVKPHVTLSDVLDPAFWTNVAAKMQTHHRVVVDVEDASWSAQLIVRDAHRTAARMGVERFSDFDAQDSSNLIPPEEEEYEIKWGGPAAKYRVIRLSDGKEMIRELVDKQAARDYIRSRIAADRK